MTDPRDERFFADYPVPIVDVPTDRHAVVQGRPGKRKRPDRPEVAAAGGHTGAMIALIPSAEHVDRLAVEGGEPAEELHLTVMYLGEAADIPEDVRAGLHSVAAAYAASTPVIEGDGFAVEVFNPHTTERDTALVMGVGGQPLADLHAGVSGRVGKLMNVPDNHAPWRPHVTLAYSDDLGRVPGFVDKLGPVVFDRLRVAMGDDVTDYPLTGGGNDFDVRGWASGNAGKLRLGQPGGFRRCVRRLRDEPGVSDPEGLCATLHHQATGKWPGEAHIVTAAASEDMPGPEQLAAALAYEEQLATAVPGAHFHTLMHTEGVSTGRRVQMPGSWTWRTPPIPFNWDKHTAMHGGVPEVVTVGLVTEIARTGREIHGWGMLDLDDPHGLEYARKLAQGWVRGVSVGPDEQPMNLELIYSPTDPEQVIQEVYHSGNIYEVTSSDGMAQATAYVEPLPALIEALNARGIEVAAGKFSEEKHKRDNNGKFAKKAGTGAGADVPAAPKAEAPRAAKPRARKAAGDLRRIASPRVAQATREKMARDLMEGTFAGLDVKVARVEHSRLPGGGHVTIIQSDVFDKSGAKVGIVNRAIRNEDGELSAHHDYVGLRRDLQGKGFSRALGEHLERKYAENGIDETHITVGLDGGGYSAARTGFDFADAASAEKVRASLATQLERRAAIGVATDEDRKGRAVLSRMEKLKFGDPGYPTAREISEIGRPKEGGKGAEWLGKTVLNNAGAGYKKSNVASKAETAGAGDDCGCSGVS